MAQLADVQIIGIGRVMAEAHRWRETAGDDASSLRKMILANRPDIIVTGEALPSGVLEAVALDGQGTPTIIYNRRYNNLAQRVAVAHGVAHVLFDLERQGQRFECAREYEDARPALTRERRADLFAGELLAPIDEVDRQFKGWELFPKDGPAKRRWDDFVDHVASRMRIPAGFLRWRLYDLAKLRTTNWAT